MICLKGFLCTLAVDELKKIPAFKSLRSEQDLIFLNNINLLSTKQLMRTK